MLTFKKIKESDTSYAHTEVWYDKIYLGYYIRNKSKFAAMGENWNFVSKNNLIKSFHGRTRNELINTILEYCNKDLV